MKIRWSPSAVALALTIAAHGWAGQEKPQSPTLAALPQGSEASLVARIKAAVDTITELELRRYVEDLAGMGTRYAPSEGNRRAASYIGEQFSSFGLTDVTVEEFPYYVTETRLFEPSRNVVGVKKGMTEPDKFVILAAHFDTVTRRGADGKTSFDDANRPAPGADDNATGVAALLAAAKALRELDFDYTIRFIAFSAEEGGIHGSARYAAECARRAEDIVAVINVDMIGYVDQHPEDIDIFANRESEWLLDEMVANAPLYAPGLLVYRIVDDRYDGSDHGPFWHNGYAAVCLMEDYYPSNPNYHSPADSVETIDFSFALQSTRLAAATLAELAGIRGGSGPSPPRPEGESGSEGKAGSREDAGKRFLVTLSPSAHRAESIDISLPTVHSRCRIKLDEVPPETWATSCYYPVAMTADPSGRRVYVSMMRLRALAKEGEGGSVVVLDPEKGEAVNRIRVGTHPGEGCLDSEGRRLYLPYRGESRLDVLDAISLERVESMPIPQPVAKLVLDDKGERAVAISPETGSVWIVDLKRKQVTGSVAGIGVPMDVVLLKNGEDALVCGYEDGLIYQIDVQRAAIVDRVASGPRPVRLIASPEGGLILSIHRSSDRVGAFRIRSHPGAGRLTREEEIVLGEEVADGAFSGPSRVYFVSSGRHRLFGLDLTTRQVVWGMRTGDVRAEGGVERLLFLRPR